MSFLGDLIGKVIPGAGLVLDIFGAVTGGSDQEDAYDDQAEAARAKAAHTKLISEYNAKQLRQQATRVRRKGVEEENETRRATAELISSQRASFGAGNIIADTGTAANLQVDAARLGEVDALRVRRNHQDESLVLDERARITLLEGDAALTAGENQADALTRAGDNARIEGFIEGAGSVFDAVDPKWFNSDSSASQIN